MAGPAAAFAARMAAFRKAKLRPAMGINCMMRIT
jgi:hypothetical protein